MQSSRASEEPQDPQQPAGSRADGTDSAPEQRDQERQPDSASGAPPSARRARELEAEMAALEDRYRRALADLENYRKRSAREIDRRVAEGRESLIRDWLEALDSVERALRMSPEGSSAEGLRAVLEQMEAILGREGVERIGSPGERFDPERFEAVGVRSAEDVPDRTVVEVVRSGFGYDGRVLRPAQVIVADAQRRDSG